MAKFDIGDKVALIHEKATGIITDIQGNLITVYIEQMEMDIQIDSKLLMLVEKKPIEQNTEELEQQDTKKSEILDKELEKLSQQGIGYQSTKPETQKKNSKMPSQIDLHWEVLQNTNPIYANVPLDAIDEIFRIQRLEFENFFLSALSSNLSAITIIHGIGSGKLRDYIHSYIKRHAKNIDSYQVMNEGGLTQVIFKLSS